MAAAQIGVFAALVLIAVLLWNQHPRAPSCTGDQCADTFLARLHSRLRREGLGFELAPQVASVGHADASISSSRPRDGAFPIAHDPHLLLTSPQALSTVSSHEQSSDASMCSEMSHESLATSSQQSIATLARWSSKGRSCGDVDPRCQSLLDVMHPRLALGSDLLRAGGEATCPTYAQGGCAHRSRPLRVYVYTCMDAAHDILLRSPHVSSWTDRTSLCKCISSLSISLMHARIVLNRLMCL